MSELCAQGDARTEEAYDRALGSLKADLLLADPPYCLLTRRRKGGDLREPKGRKIDRDPVLRFETVRDYRIFTKAWLPKALARLVPGAKVILWTNFLGKQPLLETAAAHGYGHLLGEYVWAKRTKEGTSSEQLLRVYEVALVLSNSPAPTVPLDAPSVPWAVVAGYDDEEQGTRWGEHPHHKPFGVLEPLLRQYSRPGALVLDPFAGSGSVPAAALALGRRAACIELVPEWAERVEERLREAATNR